MKVQLNPLTFKRMVEDSLTNIHGGDNRYFFPTLTIHRLQESAEEYILGMWNHIRDIVLSSGRQEVLPRDIEEWKSVSDFNTLVNRSKKRNNRSLCSILDSLPKRSKV